MSHVIQKFHKTNLSFMFLIGAAIVSYYNFSLYQPKALKTLEEVKGAKITDTKLIPYPDNSQELGVTNTKLGKQVTLEVQGSSVGVQQFYKNILTLTGWQVENESVTGDALAVKYKKSGEFILIATSSSLDSSKTLVNIDIGKR